MTLGLWNAMVVAVVVVTMALITAAPAMRMIVRHDACDKAAETVSHKDEVSVVVVRTRARGAGGGATYGREERVCFISVAGCGGCGGRRTGNAPTDVTRHGAQTAPNTTYAGPADARSESLTTTNAFFLDDQRRLLVSVSSQSSFLFTS